MQNLRLSTWVAAALCAVATAACSDQTSPDSTLRVRNDSDFAIVEIHVTPVGNSTWGDNLLTSDLVPGDSLLLGIDCGTYDALLVDESGVSCELHDLDLCLNDADWIIRNDTCTVFSMAQAAREAAGDTKTAPAAPGTRGTPAH
jgi:hypothetical protein